MGKMSVCRLPILLLFCILPLLISALGEEINHEVEASSVELQAAIVKREAGRNCEEGKCEKKKKKKKRRNGTKKGNRRNLKNRPKKGRKKTRTGKKQPQSQKNNEKGSKKRRRPSDKWQRDILRYESDQVRQTLRGKSHLHFQTGEACERQRQDPRVKREKEG